MDLLFSYKGGDEFMNNVLLYFALKHDGDFEKIYNDIKAKVPVDENEFIKAYKQHTNVPIQRTSHLYETDIYVEPNKKSSKGGKEIVIENTLNATEAYDYNKEKLFLIKS